jgi:hypothetical protein
MSEFVLIPPQTMAFGAELDATHARNVTIAAPDLSVGEIVSVYVQTPLGLADYATSEGTLVALRGDNSALALTLPGGVKYYITKGSTSGEVGVYVYLGGL